MNQFFIRNMRALIFCFCIIFLFGCEKRINTNEIIGYDITDGIEKDEHIFLSSIAEEISYIPLETNSECLITRIGGIVFTDHYILVSDDLNQLFLFNHEGKFLRQIGKKGHGPFEYVHTSDALFSENGEEIFLFDGATLKLIKFNSSTGKGIKEVRINRFVPRNFKLLNDTILAFYCSAASFPFFGSYYHVFLMNTNLEIIDSLFHSPELLTEDLGLRNWGLTGSYKRDDKLFFWDSDSDTIYSLDQERRLAGIFELKYDKYKMPASIIQKQDFEKNSGNYFFYDGINETDNYFFIDGIYQGRYMKSILYNKISNQSSNVVFNYDIHDRGFHNDLDGGIPFWPRGVIGNNKVYDVVSPYKLKSLMSNDYFKTIPVKYEEKQNELLSLIENSDPNDNPLIIFVKLK
jgi:hypothetical protein